MKNQNKKDSVGTKKIINWNNYQQSEGEYNTGEVLTVPDQAYTIQQILDKFNAGIPLNIGNEPYYSDSQDFDDVDMRSQVRDFTDIPEITENRFSSKKSKQKQKEDSQPTAAPLEANPLPKELS